MEEASSSRKRPIQIGFRTSIITVFIAVVLLVGLTLVYLSFERVSLITRTAAAGFIEKVAQLGADHIDEQFRNVRDGLEILAGLPSIQEADIEDNSQAVRPDGLNAAQQSAALQSLCRIRGRILPGDGRDRPRQARLPREPERR